MDIRNDTRARAPAPPSAAAARGGGTAQPDVVLYPEFLARDEAERCFRALRDGGAVDWRQDELVIYGRRIPLPRLTAWYGEPGVRYAYSGIEMRAVPWDGLVRDLARRVHAATGARFNGVLLNLYRDERDGVSWHSDDEPELGPAPVIASLSLGATRVFQLRHRQYRRNGVGIETYELHSGSLLVMRGDTQRHWQHRLPRRAAPCGARINLSFRWIEGA
jgi:alkylated DNA repair dioxygenase AlkB